MRACSARGKVECYYTYSPPRPTATHFCETKFPMGLIAFSFFSQKQEPPVQPLVHMRANVENVAENVEDVAENVENAAENVENVAKNVRREC